jgi:predicted secreted protein
MTKYQYNYVHKKGQHNVKNGFNGKNMWLFEHEKSKKSQKNLIYKRIWLSWV